MKLVSVNVSLPKTIVTAGETVSTGIFKEPVPGPVMLRRLNLDGDGQADRENHGGVYQAVYAYPHEHYAYWAGQFDRESWGLGLFGENFTVEGMLEDEVYVGDVFRVGQALVEVTQPRVPCYKLALKMESPHFPKQFLQSRRVGFYMRVLEEGAVEAGNAIERVRIASERMTIRAVIDLAYFDRKNLEMARHAAGLSALSPGWRRFFEERLTKAERSAA